MACCGKSSGVVNATPTGDFVSLTYLQGHTNMVRYEGYLKRAYRVNRGAVIDVHPDDVEKLMRSGFFAVTPKQNTAVESEPAPDIAPEPIQEPASSVNIDATDGALELAEANGIDLSAVEGTGANGRIVLRDVKALISD